MGITREAFDNATRAKQLFTVEFAGQSDFPAFFTDPHLDPSALERISQALGELPDWDKWAFFTTPKLSLARPPPFAALEHGNLRRALAAALGYSRR